MAVGSIANLFVSVGADIKGFAAGMSAVDAQTKSAAASLKRNMLIGGAAVGLGLGLAVKAAAGFESSLNTMQAASHATGDQMKAVSALAKKLGADVQLPGASAADAAQAMTTFAKAGLSVKDSMAAARPALVLAAAAEVDNATAADMVASALGMFSLKGKDATKVVDLFAAAANQSTATMGDISAALNQSGQVAKHFGLTIQETVGALTLFANAGLKGSDAGTSLKTMLIRLQAPMGEGAKAIAEYGINLRDMHGNMLPLPAIVGEFQNKLGGLSNAQRDAALAAIFGTDSVRAFNTLMDAGPAKIAKVTDAVGQQGAAQEVASAKMKGFNGSMEAMKSALETAAITVGTALLPALTQGVQGVSAFISKFTETQQFANILQGLGAAASTAMSVLGGALRAVVPIISAMASGLASLAHSSVGPLVAGMAAGAAAAYYLVKAFTAARAAALLLFETLSKNPWIAVATGIAMVIGGLFGMMSAQTSARSAADQLRDALKAQSSAAAALTGSLKTLQGATLDHRQAELSLKQALADRRAVQDQVTSGALTGAAAERALEQANINVGKAGLEVVRSEDALTAARKKGLVHAQASLDTNVKAVALAGSIVRGLEAQSKSTIYGAALTGDLAAAQENYRKVVEKAAAATGKSASQLEAMAKLGGPAAGQMRDLAAQSSQWSASLGRLKGQLDKIVEAAPATAAAASKVGAAISQGIASGVRAARGAAIAAAVSVAQDAVAAAKAHLKVGSPSQVMADEVGKPMAEGIALGIVSNQGVVTAAMSGLGQAMIALTRVQATMQRQEDTAAARDRANAITKAETDLQQARAKLAKEHSSENVQAVTQAEQALTQAQLEQKKAGQTKVEAAMTAAIERWKAIVDAAKTKLADAFSRLGNNAFQAFDDATSVGRDKITAQYNAMFKELDRQASRAIASLQSTFDKAKGAIADKAAELTPTEALIKNLQDVKQTAEQEAAVQDAFHQLQAAQAAGNADDIAAAQKAYDDARYTQTMTALEKQAAAERQAKDAAAAAQTAALDQQLSDQTAAMQSGFDAQRAIVQAQMDDEQRIYDTARAIQRANLESHLAALQTKYESGKITAAQANAGILQLLAANGINFAIAGDRLGGLFAGGLTQSVVDVYKAAGNVRDVATGTVNLGGPDMYNSGLRLGQQLAAGIAASANTVSNAAAGLVSRLSGPLQLQSPAKEGPLSTVDRWWKPLVPMLTAQLDLSGVQSAGMNVAGGLRGGMGTGGGGYAGAPVNLVINLNGTYLGSDRAMVREIARTIQPELNRLITLRTG